jgi:Fic family protein
MIFRPPQLQEVDYAVLGLIKSQRDNLKAATQSNPKRWFGSLRRSTLARAIRASNSIEGIHASMENVLAAVENEDPTDIERDTWLSIQGYRDAMTYILQAAQDPYFEFSKQFLKSLQFMTVGHDLTKNPGQWRPGSIFIVNQATGETVYKGPDADDVNDLIGELVEYLKSPLIEHVIVRGAMAHLNLTMIHPFKDGNGRISRALQTLVLAREGILHPVFCSIEEWLGRVTAEYYAILAGVTLIRRNLEYGDLYQGIEKIVAREGLPERATLPLFDAALGTPIINSWYRRDAEVSEAVASRDLKRLIDLKLLEPHGEKRGRNYESGKELKELRKSTRHDKPYRDPYEYMTDTKTLAKYLAYDHGEPRLPGV